MPRNVLNVQAITLALCGGFAQGAMAAGEEAGHDAGISIASSPDKRVPAPSKKSWTYTARVLIGTRVKRTGGTVPTCWIRSVRRVPAAAFA
jgi:hypothetical protein